MENRYKLSPDLQKKYLTRVEKTSRLSGDELAKLFGIVGRSYRDWRRGKFAITESAVNIIEKKYHVRFPYSKEKSLTSWKKSKLEAARKGGVNTLIKYGSPGTPEGRRKGGKHAMAILRAKGIIPPAKPFHFPKRTSSNLAEFVGILLGDGHIGKKQWSVTINSIVDKEYAEYIFKLAKKLFRFEPAFYKRKNMNAVVICGSGIKSIEYFRKLGLKVGNKVKQQVDAPKWIKDSYIYRISCLRGLMDTDGGVFLHRYYVNGKQYIYKKICFSNRSIPLLYFVADVLKGLSFTPKIIDEVENKKVWLYNAKEVESYLKIVGTHNSRLLKYQNINQTEASDSWSIREVC